MSWVFETIHYKPVCVSFKTSIYDIDKYFSFKTDYDENGICYYFGTNFGKNKIYKNPSLNDLIIIKPSSWWKGDIHDVIGRKKQCKCSTNNQKNSYIIINFLNYKINPCSYSLRHGHSDSWYCLKNWTLSGSNDGKNWFILKIFIHVCIRTINSRGGFIHIK